SGTLFRYDDVFLGANERMHRAKIRLGSGRVVGCGPTPPCHAFYMAAVIGARCVEHGGNHGWQELYLAKGIASTGHGMFRKRTPCDLDALVAFNNAVVDVLSCLEATPLHNLCPPCLPSQVRSPAVQPGRPACPPYQSWPAPPPHRRREVRRDGQA